MEKVRRGIEILRNEGPVSFARKSTGYIHNRLVPESPDFLKWYREVRGGTLSLTVNDHTAIFDAAPSAGGGWVRSMHDSETELTKELLNTLKPDDVFYDIGANIGFHSCFAARYLTEGIVVAIEPYQPNVRQLRANLQHNGGDTFILEAAASDCTGTVELTAPEDEATGHQVSAIAPTQENGTYTTRSVTVDSLIANNTHPAPNVVKIDVEGAEQKVIEGMQNTLHTTDCRTVFCELHHPNKLVDRPSIQEFGGRPEQIRQTLTECGFSLTTIEKRRKTSHIKATKSTV